MSSTQDPPINLILQFGGRFLRAYETHGLLPPEGNQGTGLGYYLIDANFAFVLVAIELFSAFYWLSFRREFWLCQVLIPLGSFGHRAIVFRVLLHSFISQMDTTAFDSVTSLI